MTATTQPYLETFGCFLEAEDGHEDHDAPCEWGYQCSACGCRVDDGPCPDHAPLNVPGMLLVACDATPRHWSWVLAHDGYEGPCWRCEYERLSEMHSGCRHSHHKAWRRWRVVHKAVFKGWGLGVIQPGTISYGGGCNGCMTGIRWGRTNEVLFRRREWWSCLLRRHHLFVPVDCADWMCGRCCPDPDEPA